MAEHRNPAVITVPGDSAPLLAGELSREGLRVSDGAPYPFGAVHMERGADGSTVSFTLPETVPDGQGEEAEGHVPADSAARFEAVRAAWQSALGARTVLLAEPRSFCAGVDRAIEVVEEALEQRPHPVYVRKQIVHNTHVVRDLAARGAVFVDELDEVPAGATVVFSAHGVAPAVRTAAELGGLHVLDATCPLVTKVHAEVRRYARRGDRVFLIGHEGHEESEGTLGEAPDRTTLVQSVEEVAALPDLDEGATASYALQTTLAVDEAEDVVLALQDRYPGIQGPGSDDICYATTNRQASARAVADSSDLVLVVGSRNSSNSVRLVEVAERAGARARLVEDVGEVRLTDLCGADTIGLTAGASAAPALVDEIVRALRGLGSVSTSVRRVAQETVTFSLPKELSR
ncbi:4-hydroxy-3-methylbut-2-enyl diphosphate reductase [Streptomyces sp. NPDC088727]|uniref:4-hydroxy-3-methylbut-2-enyl diphosphate reductase n=1 Tax=Streptomyces sp. NPDC088727 TaxID=3365875 RepID=UPI003822D835